MKAYDGAKSGQRLSGSVDYLSERLSSRSTLTPEFSLKSLVDAYKHRAAR